MAVAFVKAGGSNSTKSSGTTLAATVPAGGHAVGNTVIVWLGASSTAGLSVSDARGNTYTQISPATFTTSCIFASVLTTALQAGAAITGSGITSGSVAVINTAEFSGATVTTDGSGSTSSTTAAPGLGGSTFTPGASGDLLLASVWVNGPSGDRFTNDTATYDASTWQATTRVGTTGGSAASNYTLNSAYLIGGGSTGSTDYKPTLGTSHQWIDTAVAIKASVTAPVAVVPNLARKPQRTPPKPAGRRTVVIEGGTLPATRAGRTSVKLPAPQPRMRKWETVPRQITVPPMIPPNRWSSGRSRIAAIVKGRRVSPVPAQQLQTAPPFMSARIVPKRLVAASARGRRALVPQDAMWTARPTARGKITVTRPGRRTLPVPAQIPVPAPLPGNRQPQSRRLATLARAKRTAVPADQTRPIAPSQTRLRPVAVTRALRRTMTPVERAGPLGMIARSARRLAAPIRPKRTVPPVTQPPPLQAPALRRRVTVTQRKRRQLDPPWPLAAPIAPVWVPAPRQPRLKVALARSRGRSTVAPALQAPTPRAQPPRAAAARTVRRGRRQEPPWTMTTPAAWTPGRPRIKPTLPRRGQRHDPSWTIVQPPVGNWTPPTSRARVKPAALRRGRRADPHFWGLAPRICEPTSALIAAYASTAATAYSSSAAITAYSSAATITRYTSTAVITGYGSSSAITGYGTSSTIVTYTSTGSISRCSGP